MQTNGNEKQLAIRRPNNGTKALALAPESDWQIDTESEKYLAGALLEFPDMVADEVVQGVSLAAIHEERHRVILRELRTLKTEGINCDAATLVASLRDSGRLEQAGGASYILHLAGQYYTRANVYFHAERIARDANRIKLLGIVGEVAKRAAKESPEDLVAELMLNIGNWETAKYKGLPTPIAADRFVAKFPELRKPVIFGLFREGETANFIAATKVGKSWLMLNLIFAVLLGEKFLDTYQTAPGKVIVFDNELQHETLAERIRTVAVKFDAEHVLENLVIVPCRGKLIDIFQVGTILNQYPPGTFKLVIIDAWYRCLPDGVEENSNDQIKDIYNAIDAFAERLGCAVACVHHASKGSQASKAVTDVGSGAGSQSRAVDCHIVLRPHEENGAVVLDAAVRSFKPIEPACFRFDWPLWKPAPELDPTQLKPDRPRRQRAERADKPDKPIWDLTRFEDEILTEQPQTKKQIIAVAYDLGLSEYKADKLLSLAETKGKAYRWKFAQNEPPGYATKPQPLLIEEGGEGECKNAIPDAHPRGVSASIGGTRGKPTAPPTPKKPKKQKWDSAKGKPSADAGGKRIDAFDEWNEGDQAPQ